MELLQMKIFDLFLEPDVDFIRFPKHKPGWGVWYPGQSIFTTTIYHRLSDKVHQRTIGPVSLTWVLRIC